MDTARHSPAQRLEQLLDDDPDVNAQEEAALPAPHSRAGSSGGGHHDLLLAERRSLLRTSKRLRTRLQRMKDETNHVLGRHMAQVQGHASTLADVEASAGRARAMGVLVRHD